MNTDLIQLVCLPVVGHKCNTRPKKTVNLHLEWYLLWWLCTSFWKSYFTQGKVEKQSTINDHYSSFLYLRPVPTLKVTGLPLITMYILFHTDMISHLKVWILETRILKYLQLTMPLNMQNPIARMRYAANIKSIGRLRSPFFWISWTTCNTECV